MPECIYCGLEGDLLVLPNKIGLSHEKCARRLIDDLVSMLRLARDQRAMIRNPGIPEMSDDELNLAQILNVKPHQRGQIDIIKKIIKDYDGYMNAAYDCISWYESKGKEMVLPATALRKWLERSGNKLKKFNMDTQIEMGMWGEVDD